MSGKGSKPRPFSVSFDEYAANFDRIFGGKAAGKECTIKRIQSEPEKVAANEAHNRLVEKCSS